MKESEIQKIINSIEIIIDTREGTNKKTQGIKHITNYYNQNFMLFSRECLSYGDYTYKFMIDGKWYLNKSLLIERKMDWLECIGCFANEEKRTRLIKEFKKGLINGSDIYLLVENAAYEDFIYFKKVKGYKGFESKIDCNTAKGYLWHFINEFNIRLICTQDKNFTGSIIYDICKYNLRSILKKYNYNYNLRKNIPKEILKNHFEALKNGN